MRVDGDRAVNRLRLLFRRRETTDAWHRPYRPPGGHRLP